MPCLTGVLSGIFGRVIRLGCALRGLIELGVFASVFLRVERLGAMQLVFLARIKHRTLLRASHPAAGAFGWALPSGGDAGPVALTGFRVQCGCWTHFWVQL